MTRDNCPANAHTLLKLLIISDTALAANHASCPTTHNKQVFGPHQDGVRALPQARPSVLRLPPQWYLAATARTSTQPAEHWRRPQRDIAARGRTGIEGPPPWRDQPAPSAAAAWVSRGTGHADNSAGSAFSGRRWRAANEFTNGWNDSQAEQIQVDKTLGS